MILHLKKASNWTPKSFLRNSYRSSVREFSSMNVRLWQTYGFDSFDFSFDNIVECHTAPVHLKTSALIKR